MNLQQLQDWKRFVPDLVKVLELIDRKSTIAIGFSPYSRITPALFLKNYAIYSVKDTTDNDTLREYAKIFCLEERHPKVAAKVHATGYLLRNYAFQAFLKSRRLPYRLMFYQTTQKIVDTLNEFKIDWVGNEPKSFDSLKFKGEFRRIVRERGLPCIPNKEIPREEFFQMSLRDLWELWRRSFVVQRADFDVAGELGTFFIRSKQDWETAREILIKDERYTKLTVSPFVDGYSLSMLGCVTAQGVLSGTLQLQLIDIPESLHGQLGTGVFMGHDFGFRPWNSEAEETAQKSVESLGAYLADKGYRGIFGIDFIMDKETGAIFPIECNPRFTGALPLYSLMSMWQGVPPLELFHLISNLRIDAPFNFDEVNQALKQRKTISHVFLTPKGISEMKLPMASGIYSYQPKEGGIRLERYGAFPWELKNENEFIVIDAVPRVGGRITKNVARLFKLVFPQQIATSSFSVKPEIGQIITKLSTALRKDQSDENDEDDSQSDEIDAI
ncbi:MAG: ATP-grasp domain-containing protein [bacterium]|nr:ATP-grasp domain-containing protein [bacterium]